MKNLLFGLLFVPSMLFAQQIKTTITNGDFYNPLTWNCLCFPESGDSLIINHALSLNTDIYYTAGRITINPTGSLIETGGDRDIWIDGGGSLVNHGTFTVNNLLLSQWAYIDNTGNFIGLDSMLTQGTMNNSGTIEVYDFLNDQTGNFGNYGALTVTNNMNNQGDFLNYADVTVANDFSNCNTQSMNSELINYSLFCIENDFLNCDGDLITGSGHFYIGNQGSNIGELAGTLTFHTPSGTLFNIGTVGPGVTFTTGTCNLTIDELAELNLEVYPNPASEIIYASVNSGSFTVLDLSGKVILHGDLSANGIDISQLNNGMYYLTISGSAPVKFIKH